MARVVFTTWGSLGDLHPFLAIAIGLKRRGHAAVVATLPSWRANVERAGIEFRPIRPDVAPDAPGTREIVRQIMDPRGGPEYLFTRILSPMIRETYEDTLTAVEGADLLVSHQLPQTAPLVAAQTGITWVSAVLAPGGFLSAYDPPSPPPAPALRALLALHPIAGRLFNRMLRQVTNRWMDPVYRLRESLGLPRNGHPLFEGQHSPVKVLALFSPIFAARQPDYPPQSVVTGFPFYDEVSRTKAGDSALVAFLNSGEPPVLFTLGSSAVWISGDFYAVSIAAVRALGRRALLLVGENAQALRAQVPESIGVFDYAPHELVMPRAAVIVHQGGIGTTARALRSCRPMLVVPFGQDQPDNARRAVRLGVGRTIARTRYRVDRLMRELSLLGDPAVCDRAHAVGLQIEAERGVENACDELEKALDG
jgi:rhamnosyltransferase subunit B